MARCGWGEMSGICKSLGNLLSGFFFIWSVRKRKIREDCYQFLKPCISKAPMAIGIRIGIGRGIGIGIEITDFD